MSRIELGTTATDRQIIREANSFGLEVLTTGTGYVQFRDAGEAKAWMTPTTGRKWIGCDGTNSFTSTKAKVANWCTDQAVNGPA